MPASATRKARREEAATRAQAQAALKTDQEINYTLLGALCIRDIFDCFVATDEYGVSEKAKVGYPGIQLRQSKSNILKDSDLYQKHMGSIYAFTEKVLRSEMKVKPVDTKQRNVEEVERMSKVIGDSGFVFGSKSDSSSPWSYTPSSPYTPPTTDKSESPIALQPVSFDEKAQVTVGEVQSSIMAFSLGTLKETPIVRTSATPASPKLHESSTDTIECDNSTTTAAVPVAPSPVAETSEAVDIDMVDVELESTDTTKQVGMDTSDVHHEDPVIVEQGEVIISDALSEHSGEKPSTHETLLGPVTSHENDVRGCDQSDEDNAEISESIIETIDSSKLTQGAADLAASSNVSDNAEQADTVLGDVQNEVFGDLPAVLETPAELLQASDNVSVSDQSEESETGLKTAEQAELDASDALSERVEESTSSPSISSESSQGVSCACPTQLPESGIEKDGKVEATILTQAHETVLDNVQIKQKPTSAFLRLVPEIRGPYRPECVS
jgi:hypothetical protein